MQTDKVSATDLQLSAAMQARQTWRPQGVGQAETFLRNRSRRAGRIGKLAAQWETWYTQFSSRLRPRPGWASLGLDFAEQRAGVSETFAAVRALPLVPPVFPGETPPIPTQTRSEPERPVPAIQRKRAPAVSMTPVASVDAAPLARPPVGLAVLGEALRVPGGSETAGLAVLLPRLALNVTSAARREQPGGFPSPQSVPVRQGNVSDSPPSRLPERGGDYGWPPDSSRPVLASPLDSHAEPPLSDRPRPDFGESAANPGFFPSEAQPAVPGRLSPDTVETSNIVDWLLGPDGMPRPLPGLEIRPIPAEERQAASDAPNPTEPDAAWGEPKTRETRETRPLDINAVAEQVAVKMQRRQRLERERKGLY